MEIFTLLETLEEELEKRYKYLSKYEFSEDKKEFIESKDYIKRSNIQKNFIEENCYDISSVFEVGAASGYNLNLYKKDNKKVFGIEPSNNNKKFSKERIMNTINSDVIDIGDMCDQVSELFTTIFQLLAVFIIVFMYNPYLSIVMILYTFIYIWVRNSADRKIAFYHKKVVL